MDFCSLNQGFRAVKQKKVGIKKIRVDVICIRNIVYYTVICMGNVYTVYNKMYSIKLMAHPYTVNSLRL